MDNIEIEIQVQVEKVGPLQTFLTKQARKDSEIRQIDEYFSPAERDFLKVRPVMEWLRLRRTDRECSLNYKHFHFDKNGKSDYRDEYETPVSSADTLRLILTALGFKPIVTVDKKRTPYRYHDYEIALDQVKGLGDFVEIEFKGKAKPAQAKQITEQMLQFLKDHKVGKVYRNYVGYPFQLLFPDEVKLEEY